jgi:hypothetical protein
MLVLSGAREGFARGVACPITPPLLAPNRPAANSPASNTCKSHRKHATSSPFPSTLAKNRGEGESLPRQHFRLPSPSPPLSPTPNTATGKPFAPRNPRPNRTPPPTQRERTPFPPDPRGTAVPKKPLPKSLKHRALRPAKRTLLFQPSTFKPSTFNFQLSTHNRELKTSNYHRQKGLFSSHSPLTTLTQTDWARSTSPHPRQCTARS